MNEHDITNVIGKATEVVFVVDTTGSMSPCIKNVKKHIEKTCEELFQDIPELKIGFIFHGDYCDGPNCYTILPLTTKKEDVFRFIKTVPNTGGGDTAECYELVLNLAKTIGWSKEVGGKIVVMIGDADPHPPSYNANKDKLDWRKELNDLKALGINVYPLQCLYVAHNKAANDFWAAIAETFSTPLLKLENFDEASMAVKGFAAAAGGSKAFAAFESKLEMASLSDSAKLRNCALRSESTKYDVIEEVIRDTKTDVV